MQNLKAALQRNLGNVLTPELAAGILMAAEENGSPINVESIPPIKHGTFTIAVERISQILDEIRPLHAAHWQETEQYRHAVALNPDYEYMIQSENAGRFMLFTARTEDGELVGNCMMYLTQSTHTRKWVAEEDTIFILTEFRKGRLGIKLIQYVENTLMSLGVTEIRVTVKTINRAGDLLKALGYQHTADQLTKVLGDAHVQ